ncbi:MAG TPA: hypothetical protein VEQ58_14255 [Polyangiaceae bacterium]|nr:hypothetical protein [Polyangiaceae bacterium]
MADFARKTTCHAAWLGPLLLAPAAFAQAPSQAESVTASLELVSTPGCGSQGELVRAILARSERIRIDSSGAAPRRLRIEIRDTGSGVTTLLSLTQPGGRRSTRTLRAADCAEALDGAALVAAVSLDPTASLTAATMAGEPPAAPAAAARPVVCPRCEPAVAPAAAESSHLEGSALLSFDAISGPAPGPMLGFGATLVLAYERGSVLSPAIRASFTHFARGGFVATGGSAEFSLDTGSLELCPLRAQAGPLRLYPCLLRISGGRLGASGSSTIAPESRGRPWWELGSSLVAQVRPARSLELSLSLAAGWPLVRDHFQFEPLEFHHVSALALSLGLGAGVTFQ